MRSTILKVAGAGALGLLLAAFFWGAGDGFRLNPLDGSLAFEYPSFATSDDSGRTWLIDRSLKRVSLVKPDGTLAWTLAGGSREAGAFFFADEISADPEGRLYVLNRIPDPPGFYTVAAEILRYSPEGRFESVVYRKDYGESERLPTLVQRGQLHSLRASREGVTWFDSTPGGLVLMRAGAAGGAPTSRTVVRAAADLLIPSATLLPDGAIAYVTKTGTITKAAPDGATSVLYDASSGVGPDGAASVPWKLQSDARGAVYFTDLAAGSVRRLAPDGTATELIGGASLTAAGYAESASTTYYALSASPGGRVDTCGDYGPVLFDPASGLTLLPGGARLPFGIIALGWALWLALALGAAAVVYLLRVLYVDALKRHIPPFMKTVAGVLALTALVGVLVSALILNDFSRRYSTQVLAKITQLVNLVPQLIDTDELEAVRTPAQFGGPEYLALRARVIDLLYGDEQLGNEGLYFALHRAGPGGLTTFMYLNGEPTITHPFSYLNDPEGPYQASLKGETQAQYSLDAWGSWMYATGPIYARDGRIVGVFEMGGDLYSFTQENNRLIRSLLLNVLTVLAVLLLALVEAGFLQEQSRKRRLTESLALQGLTPRRDDDVFHMVFMARPLATLFFTAASLSLLCLPLVATIYPGGFLGLPDGVVQGLPVSVRLFFFGLGTILAGMLSARMGWRSLFKLGLALSGGGLAVAAFAPDFGVFLGASALIGLGAGVGMIGMRALVNREPDKVLKAQGFSQFYAGVIAGTNIGALAGSWLADFVGYANVFWISLAVTAAAWLALAALFPGKDDAPSPAARAVGAARSLALFFGDRRVLAFSVLVVLPVYFASMFLYYFMPVFAAGQGASNADIGRIFLVDGLVIIYLVPALSGAMIRLLGTRGSVILSSLLWIASLVPFILMGNIPGLVFSVLIMGLAEGSAVVAHNDYLLSLPASSAVGADRAVGLFEVVGKLGETVAPIVLGFALIMGAQKGLALIAATMALALVVFLVFGGLRGARSASKADAAS